MDEWVMGVCVHVGRMGVGSRVLQHRRKENQKRREEKRRDKP